MQILHTVIQLECSSTVQYFCARNLPCMNNMHNMHKEQFMRMFFSISCAVHSIYQADRRSSFIIIIIILSALMMMMIIIISADHISSSLMMMIIINAEHISARSFSIQLLYSDQNLSARLILFLLLNETLNIYICTLNTLYNVYMHYTIKTHLPVLHICHSLWLRKIKTFQVCQNSQISGNSTTVTIWIFNRGCNVR